MSSKPILFLLTPDFRDQGDELYYCPDCTFIEGLLSFYSRLRHQLEVRYVDFPRPRKVIVELLGEEYQGCPVLVVPGAMDTALAEACKAIRVNAYDVVKGKENIAHYFDLVYAIGQAH